jgi:hypothetical protein
MTYQQIFEPIDAAELGRVLRAAEFEGVRSAPARGGKGPKPKANVENTLESCFQRIALICRVFRPGATPVEFYQAPNKATSAYSGPTLDFLDRLDSIRSRRDHGKTSVPARRVLRNRHIVPGLSGSPC